MLRGYLAIVVILKTQRNLWNTEAIYYKDKKLAGITPLYIINFFLPDCEKNNLNTLMFQM